MKNYLLICNIFYLSVILSVSFFLSSYTSTHIWLIWLIDWIVFYAVSAIFEPHHWNIYLKKNKQYIYVDLGIAGSRVESFTTWRITMLDGRGMGQRRSWVTHFGSTRTKWTNPEDTWCILMGVSSSPPPQYKKIRNLW